MVKDRMTRALAVYGGVIAVAFAVAPTAAGSPDPVPSNPVQGPGGAVAMPPGAPLAVYPEDQTVGGADPLTPFGADPLVPYGVWTP
jgi:hypothetical protein